MRAGAAVPIGAPAAVAAGALVGWQFAPAAGWIAAAAVYLVWTWVVVSRMDEQRTASHATREDPTRFSHPGTLDLRPRPSGYESTRAAVRRSDPV